MGMASGCKIKKKRSVYSITNIIAGYFKNQPVVKAWLFGSFARGEQTPESDVDILVVLDENENVGFKFFGMYEDLRELLGRNVDLVTDGLLAPFARQSVEKDKKLVYERTN
jgi:predicted nucleotidyltransferase